MENPNWREYLAPEGYSEPLLSVYRIAAAALREGCNRIVITSDAVQLGTAQNLESGRRFAFGVDLRESFERVIARDPMVRKHVRRVEKAQQRDIYEVSD